jgi:hypothetical protein
MIGEPTAHYDPGGRAPGRVASGARLDPARDPRPQPRSHLGDSQCPTSTPRSPASPASTTPCWAARTTTRSTGRSCSSCLAVNPDAVDIARDDRAWLVRVVRYLPPTGASTSSWTAVGLPTAENTHQVLADQRCRARPVRRQRPHRARTRASLLTSSNSDIIDADVRDPRALLAMARGARLLRLVTPSGCCRSNPATTSWTMRCSPSWTPTWRRCRSVVRGDQPLLRAARRQRAAERAAVAEAVLLGGDLGAGDSQPPADRAAVPRVAPHRAGSVVPPPSGGRTARAPLRSAGSSCSRGPPSRRSPPGAPDPQHPQGAVSGSGGALAHSRRPSPPRSPRGSSTRSHRSSP